MKTPPRVVAAALICLGSVITTVVLAPASQAAPGIQAVRADVLESATPETMGMAADVVPTPQRGNLAINYSAHGATVQVPTEAVDGIVIQEGSTRLEVSLPRANAASAATTIRQGVVGFDNRDGSVTAPVVIEDGSVQINTIIASPSAPREYEYDFGLPEGASITKLESGALFFYDASGAFIGGLAPAWAKGADGKAVQTRYEVRGTKVTQVVEHSSQDAYPVVADPWLGVNLFSYVRTNVRPYYRGKPVYTMELSVWGQTIYRGSAVLGLVTIPMGAGLSTTYLGYKIMTNEGWREVISRQPGANTASVQQQYVCHVRYGYPVIGSGWRWDLEAARPSNPNWTRTSVLSHRCNW